MGAGGFVGVWALLDFGGRGGGGSGGEVRGLGSWWPATPRGGVFLGGVGLLKDLAWRVREEMVWGRGCSFRGGCPA